MLLRLVKESKAKKKKKKGPGGKISPQIIYDPLYNLSNVAWIFLCI